MHSLIWIDKWSLSVHNKYPVKKPFFFICNIQSHPIHCLCLVIALDSIRFILNNISYRGHKQTRISFWCFSLVFIFCCLFGICNLCNCICDYVLRCKYYKCEKRNEWTKAEKLKLSWCNFMHSIFYLVNNDITSDRFRYVAIKQRKQRTTTIPIVENQLCI